MSQYVTPFLVLNLGSEMVFVVAQRLEAQNVDRDRGSLVLDEIISTLITPELIAELTKPQETYSHKSVRLIMEDVVHSSAMRLDNNSMERLWELITMVFKWQLTLCPDVMKLTLRHLYEIETYVINSDTHIQLQRVQNLIENFSKIFSPTEQADLREDLLGWLDRYNIRVSLLLRMGLQNQDGSFVSDPNSSAIAEDMMRNLGENIYSVTQNGRILERINNNSHGCDEDKPENTELQDFVDEMLGNNRNIVSGQTLKLAIDDHYEDNDKINLKVFDDIEVSVCGDQLKSIFDELSLDDVHESEPSLTSTVKDELLNIIGSENVEVQA